MKFIKSHWSNLLFIMIILLLIIPNTRTPIQVGVNRLLAFSPSEVDKAERKEIVSYHWEFYDLDERKRNFKEAEGKVAIVNLWATWCPPCIAEMPSLAALHDSYGDRVEFYFVSQEEPEKLRTFLDKKNYSIPVFRPATLPPPGLDSKRLPTTYLIDKKGEIVIEKSGAADWNSDKVRGLIDELLEDGSR